MARHEIGTTVAERILTFAASGDSREVTLRVGAPVADDGAKRVAPWRCTIQIEGLDGDAGKPTTIYGEDSLQALVLALDFARRMLPFYARRAGGSLSAGDEDFDIITPNARLLDFYGQVSGEAMQVVREAELALRERSEPELAVVHRRTRELVDKYGEK
jgi:hypothetical protein